MAGAVNTYSMAEAGQWKGKADLGAAVLSLHPSGLGGDLSKRPFAVEYVADPDPASTLVVGSRAPEVVTRSFDLVPQPHRLAAVGDDFDRVVLRSTSLSGFGNGEVFSTDARTFVHLSIEIDGKQVSLAAASLRNDDSFGIRFENGHLRFTGVVLTGQLPAAAGSDTVALTLFATASS
jgi:hypothetical protein